MTRAYLQHGEGAGPFLTQRVEHYREAGGAYRARFNGSWRPVYGGGARRYIEDNDGTRIALTIVEFGE